jgi:hypothetical protein
MVKQRMWSEERKEIIHRSGLRSATSTGQGWHGLPVISLRKLTDDMAARFEWANAVVLKHSLMETTRWGINLYGESQVKLMKSFVNPFESTSTNSTDEKITRRIIE